MSSLVGGKEMRRQTIRRIVERWRDTLQVAQLQLDAPRMQ